MEFFIDIIVSLVTLTLFILQLLMLARAILSWIPGDDDSALDRFLYNTTEPFISPVRAILERFNWFSGFPIDLSFLATYMLISVLIYLLPAVNF